MSYTYDQIIASGYYVFREELSTQIISFFLTILTKVGTIYERDELRIKELKRIMEFDENGIYKLKEGVLMEDIKDFLDPNLVLLFTEIKDFRDQSFGRQNVKVKK